MGLVLQPMLVRECWSAEWLQWGLGKAVQPFCLIPPLKGAGCQVRGQEDLLSGLTSMR